MMAKVKSGGKTRQMSIVGIFDRVRTFGIRLIRIREPNFRNPNRDFNAEDALATYGGLNFNSTDRFITLSDGDDIENGNHPDRPRCECGCGCNNVAMVDGLCYNCDRGKHNY